ncbi:ABL080Wp [Eremothecium gossypii ATCC 10895]|uniref:Homoserine dehydrogenase n=1 Tax=Eremothecium gossypii (strain ATCC 10895 / CBS 109.51 / FGSC 9923 / NRRL Y-1056) TaxID=284811 RepID=Q75DV3_EREGS|nr:ABL080Wp [Eremothecium gossypii ATCC 10895]AAS50691.1 ABL080Wp [Eremothecium gossypii ATCC 10895]AEY94979.1 FABL080Wp [Eremothecium gossypii FDAG1]
MLTNVLPTGTGLVGNAFLEQLLSIKQSICYNIIYVARSRAALISKDYSPLNLGSSWKSALENADEKPLELNALVGYLQKSPQKVILVDNTSSSDIADFYPNFVGAGISIATPNKKAFSSDLKLWNGLFSDEEGHGLVYHEATVGAGLPIIGTLRDMIKTNDKVEKIEGIFSGTLSYIFNEFSTIAPNSVKFSEVVKVAKSLGYTEPDPRDDLNGMDVARKVTILARIAGFEVQSPSSFPVQSLIPDELTSVNSVDEFMSRLPDYDEQLTLLKDAAARENKVLRFVGKVDFPNNVVSVGIEKYDFSHPFASLKGSDNVISIKTSRYSQPLIVQGAGAGASVTAAGVLGDVIKIAERL